VAHGQKFAGSAIFEFSIDSKALNARMALYLLVVEVNRNAIAFFVVSLSPVGECVGAGLAL